MNSTILILIIGGLISLVSAIVGILLQHILNIRKMIHESKLHPSHVLYDKQIEFLDALSQLFDDINSYITTIDVWLGEKGEKAEKEVEKAKQNTVSLTKLNQLLQKFYMYIPSEILNRINKLNSECWELSIKPDMNKTYECINLLFETQNEIREFVGVDKLSQDLIKAIGRKPNNIRNNLS